MEFVQFHPTTLYGTNILMSEGARGEGGILLNNEGKRFMKNHAPKSMDLAPRDVVARSIEKELRNGRGFKGGYVHLDLTHLGADRIKERLPGIRQISMDFAGVDPIMEPVPVQPGQHYSMGGIDVDIHGATVLPGLYAAGECACISVHGANRLGGNSLLETVVYGRLVADKIFEDIQNIPNPNVEPVKSALNLLKTELVQILERKGDRNFFNIKDAMTKTMFNKFGIFRDGPNMEEGLIIINELQRELSKLSPKNKDLAINQTLIQFLELQGMIKIAEVVAKGAINRKESRGSHKRTDHPKRDDDNYLKHTMVTLEDNELNLSYKPVILGMFTPKERVY
jgi:succinate dehydrogenase / fumarate reductase flavoprotein subunit